MDTKRAVGIGRGARIALYLWTIPELVLLLAELGSLFDPRLPQAVGILSIITLVWLLATAVVVGIWIYRAMQVAHFLQNDLTISPGWAVGWYFIPVASLWKPYQAMREIWDASVVRAYPDDAEADGTALLGWWWAAWVVRAIAGGSAQLIGLTVLIPSCIASIAAAMLLAQIIRRVTAAQAAVVDASIFA